MNVSISIHGFSDSGHVRTAKNSAWLEMGGFLHVYGDHDPNADGPLEALYSLRAGLSAALAQVEDGILNEQAAILSKHGPVDLSYGLKKAGEADRRAHVS